MEDFLYQTLQAVIIAAIPVVVPPLVMYLVARARDFQASLSDTQMYAFRGMVRVFVAAAEQMFPKDEQGEKKAYVIALAQGWLDRNHIKLDFAAIEAELEAVVGEMPDPGAQKDCARILS